MTNDGSPRAEVLAHVSNAEQQAESSIRLSIAMECAAYLCALCIVIPRHEDDWKSGSTTYLCKVVQVQIKLVENFFKNFDKISVPVHGRGDGRANEPD